MVFLDCQPHMISRIDSYTDSTVYSPHPQGVRGDDCYAGEREPGEKIDLKKHLIQRLRTSIGHLTAVEGMVEGEHYCIDILKQIPAVQASLSKVA